MSSRNAKRNRQLDRLKQENAQLRARIHAAHDHLQAGRAEAAHDVLHGESVTEAERALNGQNITVSDSASLNEFCESFNRLCGEYRQNAACVVFVPSATMPGATSIQMGGSVQIVDWIKNLMGAEQ